MKANCTQDTITVYIPINGEFMSNGEIVEDILYYDLPLLKIINENVWKNYFLDLL